MNEIEKKICNLLDDFDSLVKQINLLVQTENYIPSKHEALFVHCIMIALDEYTNEMERFK